MNCDAVKHLLDEQVALYNGPDFIAGDPIEVPHRYSRQQDIEIAGLFAATLAWGRRSTIVKKANDLMARMDNAPYDFVRHHTPKDLASIEKFKHRTFNGTDCLYFVYFLHEYYAKNDTLEKAFRINKNDPDVSKGLAQFHELFFSLEHAPLRTQKHVSTPKRNSACKRLNLLLRWMVRRDDQGVDFGLWKTISPSQLIAPCDIHVERVARNLGLITTKRTNWKTALELTKKLKQLDPHDPIKYDFALFGLGVSNRFVR